MVKRGLLIVLLIISTFSLVSAINATFEGPTPVNNYVSSDTDSLFINATIANFSEIPSVVVELNSSFRRVNYSMSNISQNTFQVNISYLANTTFQYRIYVNDTNGLNSTEYRTVTINFTQPWEYNSTYWETTYIKNIATFWASQFVPSTGAFIMDLNETGDKQNDFLRSQMLGRHIYGMAVAYNLTGNESYKNMLVNATDLLRGSFWDSTNGGFSNDDLNVSNGSQTLVPRNEKSMFTQSWASIGYLSAYWVTNNQTFLDYAEESYDLYDEKMWNSTDKAYADIANDSWTITSNEYTFSSTIDVAIALVLPLYTLTGNEVYLTRLKEITDSSISHMINDSSGMIVGSYSPGWVNTGNTENYTVGHNTKYSWYLLYMYNLTENETYKTQAISVFQNSTTFGWKDQYNIWYEELDLTTNESSKSTIGWWVIEDGLVAGQTLYKYTGNEYYYDFFKKSTGTYIEKLLDESEGELFRDLNLSGDVIDFNKSYEYKAAYHSAEAAILLSKTMDGFLGVPYGSFGTLDANRVTSSASPATSASEESAGTYKGYWKRVIDYNDRELSEYGEIKLTVRERDKILLLVKNSSYFIGIEKNNPLIINISGGENLAFKEASGKIDLNKDGKYDLLINSQNFNQENNEIEISIKSIDEEIIPEVEDENQEEKSEVSKINAYLILAGFVLIIILIALIITFKKKFKK
ncbi:AGE family epimerase/isomerase [Candidatus Pacearchaeota archaeon]|nr:AGE family epimerase/isomerase [Candidatus Pacearchaeota archaeon]